MILLAQSPAKAVNELSGNGSQQMVVTPHDIGTFLVESRRKRHGVNSWLVDMNYLADGWKLPKPVCGCPDCFAKNFQVCAHIKAVMVFLCQTK